MTRSQDVPMPESIPSPALCRWRTAMTAAGLSRRTIADRIRALTRFEAETGVPVLEADVDAIAGWIARGDVSASTRAAYHSMLAAFYRWANLVEARGDNPMDKIAAARRPRRAPRPISDAAFHRLLAAAPDKEMTAMLLLAGFQGFRVHEIAKMHGRQIGADTATLCVRGKNDAEYVLPAHPWLLDHAATMPGGYWFPSQRGAHIGGRTVSQRIRLHMITQRVPGTPHAIRHYFGSELVARGADLRVVQELMRHSLLSTTAVYVATTDARKRRALELLK